MSQQQQFDYTLERGDEEFELVVTATLTYKGAPERGPSYSSGGEPAEAPEWEVDEIRCNGALFKVWDDEFEKIYDFVAENWDWEEGE